MIKHHIKNFAVPVFLALFASFLFCVSDHDTGNAQVQGPSGLNEAAKLLAGQSIAPGSPLHPVTETAYYREYKNQIIKGWNQFQGPNIEKMKGWWKQYRPAEHFSTVLYPFSGPDILHALAFFPDADTYIMFGLESPAPVPDTDTLPEKDIKGSLNSIRQSLGTILKMNFFRTEGMAETLRYKKFNSIGTMLCFFLSLGGYEIVKAQRIVILKDGSLAGGTVSDDSIKWETPPASHIPGIEIEFRKDKGKIQRVRYFMLNVIDYSLEKSNPNFIPYLRKEAPFATVIKSASYLMHNADIKFTKIRGAVLSLSNYIVQDDSGIPISYFTKDIWKVQYHGYYDRPIPLFGHRMQPELKKAMLESSTGKLPFSYGYNYQPGKSNLMTVQRLNLLESISE